MRFLFNLELRAVVASGKIMKQRLRERVELFGLLRERREAAH